MEKIFKENWVLSQMRLKNMWDKFKSGEFKFTILCTETIMIGVNGIA